MCREAAEVGDVSRHHDGVEQSGRRHHHCVDGHPAVDVPDLRKREAGRRVSEGFASQPVFIWHMPWWRKTGVWPHGVSKSAQRQALRIQAESPESFAIAKAVVDLGSAEATHDRAPRYDGE